MEQRLEELANPLLKAQGLDLVDLEFIPRSGKALVRVYVDHSRGVTMDEIERFAREFGTLLDVEDPIPQAYTLEVSSPGLTRPLKRYRDFKWATGKAVRVITRRPVNGRNTFVGMLTEASEDKIVLRDKEGAHELEMEDIAKANLEFDFDFESLGE